MEDGEREEALGILRDALSWRLPNVRWEQVGQHLEVITEALARDDWPRFQDALYDMELSGPERVVPLRDVSPQPPPRRVRERINELVHRLEARAPLRTPETETADQEPDRDAP